MVPICTSGIYHWSEEHLKIATRRPPMKRRGDEGEVFADANPFDSKRGSYDVGYGKPPPQRRFQKGNQAAAGKGRKRTESSMACTALKIADEKVNTIINGKRVRHTRRDALARQLFEKSMKSPCEGLIMMRLLLNLEDETGFILEDRKATIEFVDRKAGGLPGGPPGQADQSKAR